VPAAGTPAHTADNAPGTHQTTPQMLKNVQNSHLKTTCNANQNPNPNTKA